MPIYIIRPKANLVTKSLSLTHTELTPESRQEQMKKVQEIYTNSQDYQEIIDWEKEVKGKKGIRFFKDSQNPGFTGTTIVEMSEEEGKQTGIDLSKFEVLNDQPINLIRPYQIAESVRKEEELTSQDLWHLDKIGSSSGITGKGINIAVLDTGIDSSHPALQEKIKRSYEFNLGEYRVGELPQSLDTDGHGTHVAGLICGKKIGVAPGANVMNAIVIPRGQGTLTNFIIALEWVAQQPEISLVNISAGIDGYVGDMERHIAELLRVGILPICAVGNEGEDNTCSPGNYRNVVSVGAINEQKEISNFSGSGSLTVNHHNYQVPHLVAPGEGVYSAFIRGGYIALNGTSMATPIVCGIAALIREKYPRIKVTDLKAELFKQCEDIGQKSERQGRGLISIRNLV